MIYKQTKLNLKLVSVISLGLLLSSCSTAPHSDRDGPPLQSVDISKIHDPIPHPLKPSKYGNPPVYHVNGVGYHIMHTASGYHQRGLASWYGTKFHGQRTSSGEPYDMFAMTAANRTLPIPVFARVTNLENGKSVIVKINDRGPFHSDRIIDLSYVAAKKLGYAEKGTAMVEVKTITFDKQQHQAIQLAAKQVKKSVKYVQYVQVGVFRNPRNAEQLRQKLAHLTHRPIAIKQTAANHQRLYKVQVGPFADKNESTQLLKRLKPLQLTGKIIII
jgi:rare lipoprotein A